MVLLNDNPYYDNQKHKRTHSRLHKANPNIQSHRHTLTLILGLKNYTRLFANNFAVISNFAVTQLVNKLHYYE